MSQEKVSVILKEKKPLSVDKFIGVTMFDELFFVKNNTLYKQTANELFSYQNVLLGDVERVEILNPLQTSIFYKEFNTYVQLDKKLGEINKIDFNEVINFSAISYAAITSNKRLWIFDTNNLQLQVYNPQQNRIEASTNPIQQDIIAFYSNYNFCWVLTATQLLQYNVYGYKLNTYSLKEFEKIEYYMNNIFLQKGNELFVMHVTESLPKLVSQLEIPIKDFSVTNETLYIYTGKELYSFAINLKQTE